MTLTKEKQKEFEESCKPLMKFLCENCHPHVKVVIDGNTAELSEGVCSIKNDEFVLD